MKLTAFCNYIPLLSNPTPMCIHVHNGCFFVPPFPSLALYPSSLTLLHITLPYLSYYSHPHSPPHLPPPHSPLTLPPSLPSPSYTSPPLPLLSFGEATANAIMWCGYPGQSGGTAIVEMNFGKFNPSGRLPVTYVSE